MIQLPLGLQGFQAAAALCAIGMLVWLFWPHASDRQTKFASASGTSWPVLARIQSLGRGRQTLETVYQKQVQDNQPYVLHGLFGDVVLLPPSLIPWLVAQPENKLSAKEAQLDILNLPITFIKPVIGQNLVHEGLIRRNLTAHLDVAAADVWDEVGLALQDEWGCKTEEWTEVNLGSTMRRIVTRACNRVFVGPELCRNDEFVTNANRYVDHVASSCVLLNLFPRSTREAAGLLFTIPIKMAYARCAKYLLPIFAASLSPDAVAPEKQGDVDVERDGKPTFASWLLDNALRQYPAGSVERDPDILARRVMTANFAAIHTTSITACNLLLDTFYSSFAPSASSDESIIAPSTPASILGDECHSVLSPSIKSDSISQQQRARLHRLTGLDSALRESLRLWGLASKSLGRKVMASEGVVLPTGQKLAAGTGVCVSGWGLHRDEGTYEGADRFVWDRFLKRSPGDLAKEGGDEGQEAVGSDSKTEPAAAVETNKDFVAWGMGKHGCPGRYFAVDVIKTIVARVLLEYEVRPPKAGDGACTTRPDNMWFEYNVMPPPDATFLLRRRAEI